MVDFLDSIYTRTLVYNRFLRNIRIDSIVRFLIRNLSNMILPVYFKLSARNEKYCLMQSENPEYRIIVSLTSFPARINKVWLVIETLLRQTYKPDTIILWLSKDQFSSVGKLPKRLLALRSRGLKIELRDGDLRSHKKYYYAINEYPASTLVTVDDDIFYNSHLIESLVKYNTRFPNVICCNCSRQIIMENNILKPYKLWKKNDYVNSVIPTPKRNLLPIGVGGVLYPPNSVASAIQRPEYFMSLCKTADDIWLKAVELLNGVPTVQTDYYSLYLPVIIKNNMSLSTFNVDSDNDIQIANVRDFCIERFNIDPFALL